MEGSGEPKINQAVAKPSSNHERHRCPAGADCATAHGLSAAAPALELLAASADDADETERSDVHPDHRHDRNMAAGAGTHRHQRIS